MANYRALADSRSRQVLFFMAEMGPATPNDLWLEFLDVPRREIGSVARQLIIDDLLQQHDHATYGINYAVFEALASDVAIFDPTPADLSEWAEFADIRIAGQLTILEQANAYVALRKHGRLSMLTWETLTGVKTPLTIYNRKKLLDQLVASNMVRASRYAGVVSLYETNHRMAELAYTVNRILEGNA